MSFMELFFWVEKYEDDWITNVSVETNANLLDKGA